MVRPIRFKHGFGAIHNLAVLFFCISTYASANDEVGLLVPPDDSSLKAGVWTSTMLTKTWYGVFCSNTSCLIKPTVVRMKEGKLDSECGKKISGSALTFNPVKPLFLIDRILAGDKVSQVTQNDNRISLESGVEKDSAGTSFWHVNFKDRHYKISLPEAYDQYSCKAKGKLPITTTVDGKLETKWERDICELESSTGDGVPDEYSILWAGDIDGDGALDLLVRLPSGGAILLLSGSTETKNMFPLKNYHHIPSTDYCN